MLAEKVTKKVGWLTDVVELNRSYVEMAFDDEELEVIETNRFVKRYFEKNTDDSLLSYSQKSLIVVLGEARSGKTTEFRLNAHKLRSQNKHAFFIRIEDLCNSALSDLESIKSGLETSDIKPFENWLRSKDDATFFLDAVDEARLRNPSDFRKAVKTFERGLEPYLKRVTMFVSCRVTGWDGKEDVPLFSDLKKKLKDEGQEAEKNSDLNREDATDKKPFCLIQILPLDFNQVAILAMNNGLIEPSPFIKAIERENALMFVSRPGDVIGHVKIWIEKGKFGTFTDLVELDINEKLKEENPNYIQNDPLSSDKAREGAEKLAAASIFCKEANLRFFSTGSDKNDVNDNGLDPFKLLNNWTNDEVKALLRRPIFDEATYGRVRFHTQTVKEYLAAKWLLKRKANGCPSSEILNCLFVKKFGKTVLIPSRRAIAAWLAPDIPEVYAALLKYNPEQLVDAADPQRLNIAQKQEVFKSYARRYEDRERTGFRYDSQGLARFAHEDLSDIILKQLSVHPAILHIQELSFDMISVGKIKSCANEVLAFAINDSHEDDLRLDALRALEVIAEEDHFKKLYEYLVSSKGQSNRFYGMALRVLYPKLDVPKFLSLFEILVQQFTQPLKAMSDWTVTAIDEEFVPDRLKILIPGLTKLIQEKKCDWLKTGLVGVLVNWMKVSREAPEWLFEALLLIDVENGDPENRYKFNNSIKELVEEFKRAPLTTKRTYFWKKFDLLKNSVKPTMLDYEIYGDRESIIRLSSEDLDWMLDDLKNSQDTQKRKFIFNTLIYNAYLFGPFKNFKSKLKDGIYDLPELKKEMLQRFSFRRRIRFPHRYEIRTWWYQRRTKLLFYKLYAEGLLFGARIRQAKSLELLCALFNEMPREDKLTNAQCLDQISIKFNTRIRTNYEKGLAVFWRNWSLKNNRGDTYRLALFGVGYEVQKGLELRNLSSDQLNNLTDLARLSFFLPDWFEKLIEITPETVRVKAFEWVDAAAKWNEPEAGHSPFLSTLGRASLSCQKFFSPKIREIALKVCPLPKNLREYVVDILSATDIATLEQVAMMHIAAEKDDLPLYWISILLQLNADNALKWLENRLSSMSAEESESLMVSLSSYLYREERWERVAQVGADFRHPKHLEKIIPLVYKHVSPDKDIYHEGTYTPDARDNAQSFRSGLLGTLAKTPGEESYRVILSLREKIAIGSTKDFLIREAENRIALDGDITWKSEDLSEFEEKHERSPLVANDLFDIGLKRLGEIKFKLESGDYAQRSLFTPATLEDMYQKFTAERLEELARGRYSVAREAEVDNGKEPDIRLFAPMISPVSIEIKRAHEWSGNKLIEQLHIQLVGQYLKAMNSTHGIYLLYNAEANRKWDVDGKGLLNFEGLLSHLEDVANDIELNHPGVERLKVIGISLA